MFNRLYLLLFWKKRCRTPIWKHFFLLFCFRWTRSRRGRRTVPVPPAADRGPPAADRDQRVRDGDQHVADHRPSAADLLYRVGLVAVQGAAVAGAAAQAASQAAAARSSGAGRGQPRGADHGRDRDRGRVQNAPPAAAAQLRGHHRDAAEGQTEEVGGHAGRPAVRAAARVSGGSRRRTARSSVPVTVFYYAMTIEEQ